MRINKNIVLVILGATLLALAFVTPAFALYNNSTYTSWTYEASASPPASASPHGSYITTTKSCGVCHAVHHAKGGVAQLLLNGTAANSCTYCHVSSQSAYTQVYAGTIANYSGTDTAYAHNEYVDGSSIEQGVTCQNCHDVHAASSRMTLNPYLSKKLLKGDKDLDLYDPTYDPRVGTAPQTTDSNELALSKWCTVCHKGGAYGYFSQDYGDDTHVMSAATNNYTGFGATVPANTTVAWVGSQYCSSCHSRGYGTAAWPHYTPRAIRFLESAPDSSTAANGNMTPHGDGVCLRCHRSGNGQGVGLTY